MQPALLRGNGVPMPKQQLKATVTTAGNYGNDKLAKNFIEGLNAATSYEGDSNNLYLLYKPAPDKQTFRMVFRVVSNK